MSNLEHSMDIEVFRKRVEELIENEFEHVSADALAGVLAQMSRAFHERAEQKVTSSSTTRNDEESSSESLGEGSLSLQSESSPQESGWTGRISGDDVRSLIPQMMWRNGKVVATIHIEATTPTHAASLLHQILNVGAVLVKLSENLELNNKVLLRLNFPAEHLYIETVGRIVHKSDRGTAIEVADLGKEDRVALLNMSNDPKYRRTKSGPLRAGRTQSNSGMSSRSRSENGRASNTAGAVTRTKKKKQTKVPEIGDEASFDMFSLAPMGKGVSSFDGFGLGATSEVGSVRRQVDLTSPDLEVLASTRKALKKGRSTREVFGPELPWINLQSEPVRVEKLAEDRVLDILLQLSEGSFTGVVHFEDKKISRQLFFDSGYLVEVSRQPRLAQEELGPMLQAADRITKRQLAMAAAHADEFDKSLERSLLELEILDSERIRHAIAGRLTYLVREICNLQSGTLAMYSSDSLDAGFLPAPPLRVHVAVERVIFDRLIKQLEQCTRKEREAQIEKELDSYPEIVAQERDRLGRAVVLEKHQRLIDRVLTGRRRLREVFTESGLSATETFALVYTLHRMGLLRFDRSWHHTVVKERFRQNVTVKYLSVHKASYFEVLNVHWSSYDEIIHTAYRTLKEQFDPSRITEDAAALDPEISQRVEEILERIEEAYLVLAERTQRHAYRARIMPKYKLDHAIPLFLKQSELAERRKQWDNAGDAIRRVLEIDPEHDEAQRRLEFITSQQSKS